MVASTEVKQQARRVVRQLRKEYPDAACALNFDTPLQLLVATILSAQCTDERVNIVTAELFAKYPTARELAGVPLSEIEVLIRSTGFFRNKAKNIKAMAKALLEQHDGEVPRTMDELLALPGVARKTANVVLGTAWGIAVGVVVDTHVQRLSQRLALTAEKTPVAIERDLMRIVPRSDWIWLSHALIWHGRLVCDARKPLCDDCTLARVCASAGSFAA